MLVAQDCQAFINPADILHDHVQDDSKSNTKYVHVRIWYYFYYRPGHDHEEYLLD